MTNLSVFMKKFILLTILVWLSSCGKELEIATNNQDVNSGQITKKQSELIFETIKSLPNDTQISIAIIENGKTHFYGVKRENDKIISIDNHNRVFEIGSITKVFTSTILAGLVLENKVNLDDNIAEHLELRLKDNQEITFKELANHTSGLPRLAQNRGFGLFRDSNNPYKDYDEEKLLEYITEKMELKEKKWAYSNIGAALLGYTLTKVEDKSYQELLDERIFSKYGMKNSTCMRSSIKDKLVNGLDENGETAPNWDMSIHVGAGGILSTAEDLSKFALAQFDTTNRDLELTRKKNHTINENADVGLGWHILKMEEMDDFYAHNGGTGGYSSSINLDVKNHNGVIILSNVSSVDENEKMRSIVELCTELLHTLGEK